MTGTDELDGDARHHFNGAIEPHRLQLGNRAECIWFRIERQCWRVLAVSVTIGLACIFLLQSSRVRQNQTTQIGGAWSAEHTTAESLSDQTRQVAAVIKMRVGQNDRTNGCGLNGQ